jgi:hypothetical protein
VNLVFIILVRGGTLALPQTTIESGKRLQEIIGGCV